MHRQPSIIEVYASDVGEWNGKPARYASVSDTASDSYTIYIVSSTAVSCVNSQLQVFPSILELEPARFDFI